MKHIPKKRIGIDARFYGPIGKGLGRYVQEIVDNVLRLDKIMNSNNKFCWHKKRHIKMWKMH